MDFKPSPFMENLVDDGKSIASITTADTKNNGKSKA